MAEIKENISKMAIPKKTYTIRMDAVIGTKKPKTLKKGNKISLTDIEAKNYKQNNII